MNSGPLGEQAVLLTSEPSLQPYKFKEGWFKESYFWTSGILRMKLSKACLQDLKIVTGKYVQLQPVLKALQLGIS